MFRDLVNGRKNSEEEEIDDDEETALNEQEIDDDEDTAMVAAAAPAQPMFSPLAAHMTFTRANDGGQETVNLSIPDTDNVTFPDINIREAEEPEPAAAAGQDQDQPLALTAPTTTQQQQQQQQEEENRYGVKIPSTA